MNVKITYFVHGTTTDNETNICTGWNQGELSETGIKQLKVLSDQIGDKKFHMVFCSDLQRAIDSAEIIFKGVYEINRDSRLREANYGNLNGAKDTEFNADQMVYIDNSFPNGESFRDVESRISNFVEFLKKNYDGKHIAIVAHRAPQLALEVLLKNKTWEQALQEDWRKNKSWKPGWEYIISDYQIFNFFV